MFTERLLQWIAGKSESSRYASLSTSVDHNKGLSNSLHRFLSKHQDISTSVDSSSSFQTDSCQSESQDSLSAESTDCTSILSDPADLCLGGDLCGNKSVQALHYQSPVNDTYYCIEGQSRSWRINHAMKIMGSMSDLIVGLLGADTEIPNHGGITYGEVIRAKHASETNAIYKSPIVHVTDEDAFNNSNIPNSNSRNISAGRAKIFEGPIIFLDYRINRCEWDVVHNHFRPSAASIEAAVWEYALIKDSFDWEPLGIGPGKGFTLFKGQMPYRCRRKWTPLEELRVGPPQQAERPKSYDTIYMEHCKERLTQEA
ncbi:MAG: hypothetical protein Q9190_007857 [Brigantiaea leucoxantha]